MRIALNAQKANLPVAGMEDSRVAGVHQFKYSNFDIDKGLRGIVKLASEICDTPIALISFLDATDNYIKVKKGFDFCKIQQELSYCTHTIRKYEVIVVEDMMADSRFQDIPMVRDGRKIRFFAGAPLTTKDGLSLGTLYVLDTQPKILPKEKQHMLVILAEQALHLVELQRSMELLKQQQYNIEQQNKALSQIAFMQSHEFRPPVAAILGLMNIIKDQGYSDSEEYFLMMEEAVKCLDEKIHMVVDSTVIANGAFVA
jgi:hypothetical protein